MGTASLGFVELICIPPQRVRLGMRMRLRVRFASAARACATSAAPAKILLIFPPDILRCTYRFFMCGSLI